MGSQPLVMHCDLGSGGILFWAATSKFPVHRLPTLKKPPDNTHGTTKTIIHATTDARHPYTLQRRKSKEEIFKIIRPLL